MDIIYGRNIVYLKKKEEYDEAVITWKPAKKWYKSGDIGVDLADDVKNKNGVYKAEGKPNRRGKTPELLYIGLTYEQDFDTRLHQGHIEDKAEHYNGEIWVSEGTIKGRHSRKRYEDIERMLIYFADPKWNGPKKVGVPECFYEIVNKGRKGLLPEKIKFPVAEIIE